MSSARGVVACSLALLLLAGGCGRDGERKGETQATTAATPTATESPAEEVGRWATAEERRWLQDLGAWLLRFTTDLAELREVALDGRTLARAQAGDKAALDEIERALEPLRRCSVTFGDEVAEPPTRRTETGTELMAEVCVHYERFAEATVPALAGDREQAREAGEEAEKARELVVEFNKMLPPGEAQSVPVVDAPSRRSRINPRYGDAAEAFTRMPTEVRCWSRRDWPKLLAEERAFTGRSLPPDTAGITAFGSFRINLAPVVCSLLDRFAYRNFRPASAEDKAAVALAVGVLAHEAEHRLGVFDEAAAECYGMQRMAVLARALGATRAYAASLEELLWLAYPTLDAEYRSPECRDGGKLDVDPASDAWP